MLGISVGLHVGDEGRKVGIKVGSFVGLKVGLTVGREGNKVGFCDGSIDGSKVGWDVEGAYVGGETAVANHRNVLI